ncbi:class I SAM-dependent methyltransferase [bacterium]|nr:class I SAM-dependent methyltransferase [bacterium]
MDALPTLIKTPDPHWGSGVEPNSYRLIHASARPVDRILDLGCARGAYVESLIKSGMDCRGMDLFEYPEWDQIAARVGKKADEVFKKIGPDRIPCEDKEFDVVFAFEVLEHAPDPEHFLCEMRRVARKYILLSVPDCNPAHPLHKYSLALHHWTDRTHAQFFTRSSLVGLLDKAGLEVLHVGGSYRIQLGNAFWDSLRIPGRIRRFGQNLTNRLQLSPVFYSGILVKCAV